MEWLYKWSLQKYSRSYDDANDHFTDSSGKIALNTALKNADYKTMTKNSLLWSNIYISPNYELTLIFTDKSFSIVIANILSKEAIPLEDFVFSDKYTQMDMKGILSGDSIAIKYVFRDSVRKFQIRFLSFEDAFICKSKLSSKIYFKESIIVKGNNMLEIPDTQQEIDIPETQVDLRNEETPPPSQNYIDEMAGPVMLQVTNDIDLKWEPRASNEPLVIYPKEIDISKEQESSQNSKKSREISIKQIDTEAGVKKESNKSSNPPVSIIKKTRKPRKKKTDNVTIAEKESNSKTIAFMESNKRIEIPEAIIGKVYSDNQVENRDSSIKPEKKSISLNVYPIENNKSTMPIDTIINNPPILPNEPFVKNRNDTVTPKSSSKNNVPSNLQPISKNPPKKILEPKFITKKSKKGMSKKIENKTEPEFIKNKNKSKVSKKIENKTQTESTPKRKPGPKSNTKNPRSKRIKEAESKQIEDRPLDFDVKNQSEITKEDDVSRLNGSNTLIITKTKTSKKKPLVPTTNTLLNQKQSSLRGKPLQKKTVSNLRKSASIIKASTSKIVSNKNEYISQENQLTKSKEELDKLIHDFSVKIQGNVKFDNIDKTPRVYPKRNVRATKVKTYLKRFQCMFVDKKLIDMIKDIKRRIYWMCKGQKEITKRSFYLASGRFVLF
eukprot:GHVP01050697.1.p1 GENE.GHVP01050697.1~~GHVP01050697.1.p1  ORF type:complete len:667 (+),score=112.75 GHVP01050697.1:2235-4235(+)